MTLRSLTVCCSAALALACGSPAVPFDTMKSANVVVYRLQNYEPPAPVAGAPAVPGVAIPGIPPEIVAMAQQALPGLQQMIPPGLLPPGMIPGLPAAPAPVPQPQAPRFHGFRILEQQQVGSSDLKEDLADLLGDEDSFQAQHANCLYAEMGISFSNAPGAPTNDVLISFSCSQVQGHNFVWPHPSTGMTPDTVQRLSDLVPQLFPASGVPVASAPQQIVHL